MVMVRALMVSPRVLVPPVTPIVRAPQVSQVSGVGVVGGAHGEGVAEGVTVDGVGDVDGRCWLWVCVCVRAVIGLLWALLAGLPAGPGGVCRLLVLSVFGGFSPFLAEGAAGDVVGGATAGVAMVYLVMTFMRVPQVGFGCG